MTYTNKDVAEVFDKVRDGKLEIRPLFYDGSGRHPRYHYNDPPFELRGWWWLVFIVLVVVSIFANPIIWIKEKVRHEKVF
jgi:hypothetical protein